MAMAHPESNEQRREEARAASRPIGLLIFLLGVVLASVAAIIAMTQDPLSTAGWSGFLAIMILAIGLELAAFGRID
jgi:hypothetical protein